MELVETLLRQRRNADIPPGNSDFVEVACILPFVAAHSCAEKTTEPLLEGVMSPGSWDMLESWTEIHVNESLTACTEEATNAIFMTHLNYSLFSEFKIYFEPLQLSHPLLILSFMNLTSLSSM